MPTPRFTSEERRELHDLAAQWAQLVSKRAFGDNRPGFDVDFRTFELIAAARRTGANRGVTSWGNSELADNAPVTPSAEGTASRTVHGQRPVARQRHPS